MKENNTENIKKSVKTPWEHSLCGVPMHLKYFEGSMYDRVAETASQYPNMIAFDFMGRRTTYRQMLAEIERCAKALKTIGVRENDKVTIAMPNCPQAIYMFYAVNMIGAVANMIHPLSAEKEIEFYLNESESVTAITLDQFYNKFEKIRKKYRRGKHYHCQRKGCTLKADSGRLYAYRGKKDKKDTGGCTGHTLEGVHEPKQALLL